MTNKRNDFKEKLISVSKNDFNLKEDETLNEYLDLLLEYIGDEDMELRDNLIYTTFAYWIEEKKYFSSEELRKLLNTVLDNNHAFYKIGSTDDSSVLKRSFSILLVNPIISAHLEKKFLTNEEIIKTKDLLLDYIKREKDLRGYDDEKGWMHSIAHAMDGILAILQCEETTEDICKEVLEVIEIKLLEGKHVLSFDEDERAITAIYYKVIENKLVSNEYICAWIENLAKVLDIKDFVIRFRAKKNIKNFIRSLYFRMLHLSNNEYIANSIIELDKKINSHTK